MHFDSYNGVSIFNVISMAGGKNKALNSKFCNSDTIKV